MNSSGAQNPLRAPRVFLIWLGGAKKNYINTHKTLTSLMFTAPCPALCNAPPPSSSTLLPVYEIEFQSSLLFRTRKRRNEFHLLRLRWAQTAGVTAAVFIKITGNPHTHTHTHTHTLNGSLLFSTCQRRLVTPTFGVNFQAINFRNITSKGNWPTFVVPLSNALH